MDEVGEDDEVEAIVRRAEQRAREQLALERELVGSPTNQSEERIAAATEDGVPEATHDGIAVDSTSSKVESETEDAVIDAIERAALQKAQVTLESNEAAPLKVSVCAVFQDVIILAADCRGDIIALGSSSGEILIVTAKDYSMVGRARTGSKATCALSLTSSGSFVATSNLDGKVAVFSLGRAKKQPEGQFQVTEVHSAQFIIDSYPLRVAINPKADESNDFAFICGGSDGRVKLTKKNFWPFGSSTDDVAPVSTLDGAVAKLTWVGDVITWNTLNGQVRLRDHVSQAWLPIAPGDALEGEKIVDFFWEDEERIFLICDSNLVILLSIQSRQTNPRKAVVSLKVELANSISYVMPFGGRNGTILTIGSDGWARSIDRISNSIFWTTWIIDSYGSESASDEYRSRILQSGGEHNTQPSYAPRCLFFHDLYWQTPIPDVTDPMRLKARTTVQSETGLPFLYIVQQPGIDEKQKEGETYQSQTRLLLVRARTMEDELQFALSNQDYERALAIVRVAAEGSSSMTYDYVADSYMTFLLSRREYGTVERVMPRVFDPQKDLQGWSKWTAVLTERHELHRVWSTLPVPGLSEAVYDECIRELLNLGQYENALEMLKRSLSCSSPSVIIELVKKEISEKESILGSDSLMILRRALALAFSATPEKVEEGFWAMLSSKSEDALEILERRQEGVAILTSVIERGKAQELAALNPSRFFSLVAPLTGFTSLSTASLFSLEESTSFTAKFPALISQLRSSARTELVALQLLRRWNSSRRTTASGETADLANQEVELCARLDSPRLLELLRDSNGYSPDKALSLCEADPAFRRETVFLLQRLGGLKNAKRALELLAYEMDDLDAALEYAERENLFDELVKVCVSSKAPADITIQLLAKAGSYSIDPACLVRALPAGLTETQSRLVKLFRDVRANLRTREIANDIFKIQATETAAIVTRRLSRGVRVRPFAQVCSWCKQFLADDVGSPKLDESKEAYSSSRRPDMVIFRTGDGYHRNCLLSAWESLYKHSLTKDEFQLLVASDQNLIMTSSLKSHVIEFVRINGVHLRDDVPISGRLPDENEY